MSRTCTGQARFLGRLDRHGPLVNRTAVPREGAYPMANTLSLHLHDHGRPVLLSRRGNLATEAQSHDGWYLHSGAIPHACLPINPIPVRLLSLLPSPTYLFIQQSFCTARASLSITAS